MSEINYSRKQIDPLIKKFAINPDTNTLFQNIIKLFEATPNYQVWAVKVIFNHVCDFDTIERIHQWITANSKYIQLLSKKNIIAYSTAKDFILLDKELKNIDKFIIVKSTIDSFNTQQKHMIDNYINLKSFNPAHPNKEYSEWCDLLIKFSHLPFNRRKNFIGRCSTFHDISALKSGIEGAITETYLWNHDDLLAFVKNNTPKCTIVFDDGKVVIVKIPDYTSSKLLGGGGHTGWCITSSKGQWDSYTNESNNDQYFLFDFNKPETDELAHIGFTIKPNRGLTAAQTTQNHDILNSTITYHGGQVSIFKAFSDLHVSFGIFIKLKGNSRFSWSRESVLDYINNNKEIAIAYDKNNRLIMQVASKTALNKLIGHTFIPIDNLVLSDGNEDGCKVYVLFDFNLDPSNDNSIIAFQSKKDMYNVDTITCEKNIFGNDLRKIYENYIKTIGLRYDDFLNREKINPSILLHKYINEGDEKGAIALINNEGDNVDINFEFNYNYPIFAALDAKMFDLFRVIVNHKNFKCNMMDGFGNNILTALLYVYDNSERVSLDKDDFMSIQNAITMILDSSNYDFNIKDISEDTALHVAVNSKKMNWITKALVSKPDVDVNLKNDFDYTPLEVAINAGNIEAIKILGMRTDLIINPSDKSAALNKGINLSKVIKPDDSFTKLDASNIFSKIKSVLEVSRN